MARNRDQICEEYRIVPSRDPHQMHFSLGINLVTTRSSTPGRGCPHPPHSPHHGEHGRSHPLQHPVRIQAERNARGNASATGA